MVQMSRGWSIFSQCSIAGPSYVGQGIAQRAGKSEYMPLFYLYLTAVNGILKGVGVEETSRWQRRMPRDKRTMDLVFTQKRLRLPSISNRKWVNRRKNRSAGWNPVDAELD